MTTPIRTQLPIHQRTEVSSWSDRKWLGRMPFHRKTTCAATLMATMLASTVTSALTAKRNLPAPIRSPNAARGGSSAAATATPTSGVVWDAATIRAAAPPAASGRAAVDRPSAQSKVRRLELRVDVANQAEADADKRRHAETGAQRLAGDPEELPVAERGAEGEGEGEGEDRAQQRGDHHGADDHRDLVVVQAHGGHIGGQHRQEERVAGEHRPVLDVGEDLFAGGGLIAPLHLRLLFLVVGFGQDRFGRDDRQAPFGGGVTQPVLQRVHDLLAAGRMHDEVVERHLAVFRRRRAPPVLRLDPAQAIGHVVDQRPVHRKLHEATGRVSR